MHLYYRFFFSIFLFLTCVNGNAQTGILFDGSNDHITFGSATSLNSAQFTIEVWFEREGAGTSTSTGTGGVTAIPLITKGRNEAEGTTADINYFLGIDASSGVIVADFEEGASGASPGLNHPVSGSTVICNNVWYHVAATYDGVTWKLFLNGIPEVSLTVNRPAQSASIQHAGLATAMTSSGSRGGYFYGRLDEARIWNYARTQNDIFNNYKIEITSATGLTGRFSLNEGSGTTVGNTGSAPVTGTVVNGAQWVTGSPFVSSAGNLNSAIHLTGSNSYLPLGNPSAIGLSQFTLEAWIKRTGAGVTTSTGSEGVTAVPVVAKGRGEEDGDTRDMNYFLGIDETNKLVADFEEGTGQPDPGMNHPVTGVTTINLNTWYHIAATYDGTTWKLYLNGILEKQLTVSVLPQSGSIQHAAIGSALNSTAVASGFFTGIIDEVRIWNSARSQSAIQSTMNTQLPGTQAGMKARLSMNENCGSIIRDSSGSSITGTMSGINWNWTGGSPFNLTVNNPPSAPALLSPADNSSNVPLSPSLSVVVSDPELQSMSVAYYARPCPPAGAAADFTIIGLPDTQYYTSQTHNGTNAMLISQMNWILNNRISQNIVFVEGLGDCVESGDNSVTEWQRFDTCMRIIEDPVTTNLTYGMPYGINVGNHDKSPNGTGTSNLFNAWFGFNRFNGRDYYGGRYGTTNNNNNYCLFSASGMDFIVINLEFINATSTYPAGLMTWVQNLLTTHSNRRAIIGTHWLIDSGQNWGAPGLQIYNVVKNYPNVFLMLCGHLSEEAKRTDIYQGDTIYTLLSDYQNRTNGGNGWMRIMKFSPANNTISVKTYSPWLNQYETDASSQFTLNYGMSSTTAAAFSLIGNNSNISSGSTSSFTWNNLLPNTCYEWYAVVSDGNSTTTSPVWKFTTGTGNPVSVNLNAIIQGYYRGSGLMAPVINSTVCDTLILELHDDSSPYNLIETSRSVINLSGAGTFQFPNATPANYYLVVKHRNSLETWSKLPVTLNAGINNYSFSTSIDKAYGNNLKDMNDGRFGIYSGDVDQNDSINIADKILLENHLTNFPVEYDLYDITGDRIVESSDYSLLENNIIPIVTQKP